MVAGYVGAWVVSGEGSSRGGGESGKKDLQSSYFLSLYVQGRRRTLLFKTVLFRCSVVFFFFEEGKEM